MNPDKSPKQIVIVGGSLTGLFCGVALSQLGHNITILERSPVPHLHDQGAGVVAGSQTLEWIQKFTGKTKSDVAIESKERLYLNKEGGEIDVERRSQWMTSWTLLYNLGREYFDGAEHKHSAGKCEYRYGKVVQNVKDHDHNITVHYTDTLNDNSAETTTADFLIVADGPSSTLRPLLLPTTPTAQRTYAGYVAFRGTVSESSLSPTAHATFVERFAFYHGSDPRTQILAYTIPNITPTNPTSINPSSRLINWVWYHNIPRPSPEYTATLTDRTGKQHHFTLPTGGLISPTVWQAQLDHAQTHLPPQYAELAHKTAHPFVQAITDFPPPAREEHTRVLAGKGVLCGDALSGFRPHTAASTSQGALHALLLHRVFAGQMRWDEYEHEVFGFAAAVFEHGVRLGERSQFGTHPLAV